jgi:3-hexulose-6-phosphate synthase
VKLQLALDTLELKGALALLAEVSSFIDIVEVGTPFIIRDGIAPVMEIKKTFPNLEILADLKIMDAGEYEADIGFSGGADIVTVLAAADDATIRGAVAAARKNRKRIMVDMMNVKDLQERAREIDALGADYICVHTAFDLQVSGNNPLEDLKKVKKVSKKAGLAVAGGIKLETLVETVKERPEIIIVGGGITGRENRREIAAAMKKIMKG